MKDKVNITVAKSAGFCFGVKRAVEIVENEIKNKGTYPIYTYGPIIHNEHVVKKLQKQGVTPMDEAKSVTEYEKGTVIIRSHGVSKSVQKKLNDNGFKVIDASCPFVKKIHKIVEEKSKEGYYIVIIGNPNHPEVAGIVGWIDNTDFLVISSLKDANNFTYNGEKKICIVSQTTFNHNKFQECVEIIQKKGYDVIAVNTICNATLKRQEEARELSIGSDIMIVIGDKHSSNSKKLYDICSERCNKTYFIETKDDLDLLTDQSIESIGITAGASTPNNIIEEVQKQCQKVLNKC